MYVATNPLHGVIPPDGTRVPAPVTVRPDRLALEAGIDLTAQIY
jgi:hypothetical protein